MILLVYSATSSWEFFFFAGVVGVACVDRRIVYICLPIYNTYIVREDEEYAFKSLFTFFFVLL